MQQQPQQNGIYCKKIVYGDRERPSVIFGIVLEEDNNFLIFQTARKEYKISKSVLISIEDTTIKFRREENG